MQLAQQGLKGLQVQQAPRVRKESKALLAQLALKASKAYRA